jgi:hypothetical protein
MKLVLTRLALAELDEILRFISKRSPLGAKYVELRMPRAPTRPRWSGDGGG